jgi:Flp pilus assembly protein TadG
MYLSIFVNVDELSGEYYPVFGLMAVTGLVRVMRKQAVKRARFLSRLWRDRRGATALEFGLIALPFFSLLLAIFETTAVFFASATLENAANDAARQIRTGQVQDANITAADFTNLICGKIAPLLACDSNLIVDVRSFQNFQAVTFSPPLDNDGQFQIPPLFSPGAAGDIVLVRVFYTWHVITPLIGATLANMAGNVRLISTAVAFRNEPFGTALP